MGFLENLQFGLGIGFIVVGIIVMFSGLFPFQPNMTVFDQFISKLTSATFTSGLTIIGLGIVFLQIASTK